LSKRKDLAATALRMLFLLWTVVVILGVFVVGNDYIKEQVYTGTDISFHSTSGKYRSFVIEGPATVEAYSWRFFVFTFSV